MAPELRRKAHSSAVENIPLQTFPSTVDTDEAPRLDTDSDHTVNDDSTPWIRDFSLENVGSVARDHMANERTMLSWLRCSSTFVVFGVLGCQFYMMNNQTDPTTDDQIRKQRLFDVYGKPIPSICVGIAIISIVFGIIRYLHVQSLLVHNKLPVTGLSIAILILSTLGILINIIVFQIKLDT